MEAAAAKWIRNESVVWLNQFRAKQFKGAIVSSHIYKGFGLLCSHLS